MSVSAAAVLSRLEAVIDTAGVSARIEALLPIGVRPRQLPVRTLLLGMLLVAADNRPAHLTGVHQALAGLPDSQHTRLGILAHWTTGPHLLSYRQVERTFRARRGRAFQRSPRRHPVRGSLGDPRRAAGGQHHRAQRAGL